MPEPDATASIAPDPVFRQVCIDAMAGAFQEPDRFDIEAEIMLDALLPVLAEWIRPHRWDKDYPESAPPGPCHGSTPDTFYAGVLHAAAVVRDLLPPKVRDEQAVRSSSSSPSVTGDTQ